jgi:hypothetical protein
MTTVLIWPWRSRHPHPLVHQVVREECYARRGARIRGRRVEYKKLIRLRRLVPSSRRLADDAGRRGRVYIGSAQRPCPGTLVEVAMNHLRDDNHQRHRVAHGSMALPFRNFSGVFKTGKAATRPQKKEAFSVTLRSRQVPYPFGTITANIARFEVEAICVKWGTVVGPLH